jgi:predicted dehydrogenase
MPASPPVRSGEMTRRTFLLAGGGGLAARAVFGAAAGAAVLKIGQIGTKHLHAAGKMSGLRSLPDHWTVVGLVDSNGGAGTSTRDEVYRGLPLMTEAELLAVSGLRAVAVETAIVDSCATAERVIRAGKHVHLDKPGAFGHAEFRAMRLEAERRGLVVQMGYMLRYNPAFELLFHAVRERWLGEVMEIEAFIGKLGTAADRAYLAALPGGGMFELGCHVIDPIVHLLGMPRSVDSYSTPSRDDAIKDNQLAVLKFDRATATVRVNYADPFGSPRRRFSVTGTEGAFEVRPLESGQIRLSLRRACGPYAKGEQNISLPRSGGRYDAEFIDLARVVHGEKALAWNATHDIAVHETVLRASGVLGG